VNYGRRTRTIDRFGPWIVDLLTECGRRFQSAAHDTLAAARRVGSRLAVRGAVVSIAVISIRTGEVLPVVPKWDDPWPWTLVRDEHGKPSAILIGGRIEAPLPGGRR
jgi:hypothetical protein